MGAARAWADWELDLRRVTFLSATPGPDVQPPGQRARVVRRVPAPVVVEVGVHVLVAAPLSDSPRPGGQLIVAVAPIAAAAVVQADIAPAGGRHVTLERPLGMVTDGERHP